MDILIQKISKIFNIFKQEDGSGCDGCAYYKNATNECNLLLITEEYKVVKAKNGCDSYLCKNELMRR